MILRPSVVLGPSRLWRQRAVPRARRAPGPAGDAGHRAAAGRAARRRRRDRRVLPQARCAVAAASRPRRAGAPVVRGDRTRLSALARLAASRDARGARLAGRSPPTGSATSRAGSAGGRRCARTAQRELVAARSATRQHGPQLTGIAPRSLAAALARRPGLGAGALVRQALPAEAGGVRGVRAVLDRHRLCCRSGPAGTAASSSCGGRRRRLSALPAVDRRRAADIAIGIAHRLPPHGPAWALRRRSRSRSLYADRRHAAAPAAVGRSARALPEDLSRSWR